MNPPDATPSSCAGRCYSPFWALCLLFVPLIFLQITYVADDLRQWDQMQTARAQLVVPLAHAQTLNETANAVGRDLVALASNSVEAARIIADFNIQLNRPPPAAK